MPDGRIEPRQADRLREMGAWLAKYGETVYGTRGGPYKPTKSLASTRRGSTIFLHVFRWESEPLILPALSKRITAASLLTGGKVEVKQGADGVSIAVAPQDRHEIDTIVKLELDGSAMDLPVLAFPSLIKASASNVYQKMDEYGAECAFDDDPHSRWATDAGTAKAWVALDLGKPTRVAGVRIQEAYPGRVKKFALEHKDGSEWKTIFTGTEIGEGFEREFAPLAVRELRLNILEATEGPTIWEIRFTPAK
jgi:alpha-L-fucosidase